MFVVSMSYEPSREEIAVNVTVKAALRRLGLVLKQAAFLIGQGEKYLDDALNGRRPLKFSRLYQIEGFKQAYLEATAEEEDFLVLDRKRVRLVEVETRPVKAALPVVDERKRA